jgi:ubiquinol-cytochrome c reductase iron-sulfur subunit
MTQSEGAGEPTRRDFLYIATGMAGVVGVGSFAWPFIDQMNPDASTLALASIEVNVEALEPGMSLTVKWRGKPVFIRNRTDEEVAEAQAVALDDLKDPIARNANVGAPTWVACRSARKATTAAGSARATARTTTPLAASARVRHRKPSGAAVRLYVKTPIKIG